LEKNNYSVYTVFFKKRTAGISPAVFYIPFHTDPHQHWDKIQCKTSFGNSIICLWFHIWITFKIYLL